MKSLTAKEVLEARIKRYEADLAKGEPEWFLDPDHALQITLKRRNQAVLQVKHMEDLEATDAE